MIRTRIFHIRVREWFPEDDAIARIMARLLVAREDLYLEMQGMSEDALPPLDECSSEWRTIYFFRNSARTLMEIRSAIEMLKQKKEFLKALSSQNTFNDAYQELVTDMDKASDIVRKLRNEVAGHLKDGAFEEGLGKIDSTIKSTVQARDRPKDTHYRFALEFIGAVILRHADADPKPEWNRILESTNQVSFRAVKAIDMLFMAYSEQRGFLQSI